MNDLLGIIMKSLSVDCGDYVVVTNAKSVRVSGNKHDQKVYYSHTMYPGGLKERRYKDLIKKNPDAVRFNRFLLVIHTLTAEHRSFVKPCLVCCPKTNFETDG